MSVQSRKPLYAGLVGLVGFILVSVAIFFGSKLFKETEERHRVEVKATMMAIQQFLKESQYEDIGVVSEGPEPGPGGGLCNPFDRMSFKTEATPRLGQCRVELVICLDQEHNLHFGHSRVLE